MSSKTVIEFGFFHLSGSFNISGCILLSKLFTIDSISTLEDESVPVNGVILVDKHLVYGIPDNGIAFFRRSNSLASKSFVTSFVD